MSTVSRPEPGAMETKQVHSYRIIVLDPIASEGIALLESTPEIEYEIHTGLSGEQLRDALQGFDGAVCRSGVNLTAESLAGNTTLKAIARAGVGTDNIDKAAATKRGIVVMNTPAGNTISTAEHTMALMLGLSRNLAPAHASLLSGKWDRKSFSGRQLHGKTLGIIGLGRIGQEVARRCKAFGMRILGYDPYLANDQIEKLGLTPVEDVETLLPEIDYLTVHTPLTGETRSLIGREEISKLKRGARLINCARGGIYDEQALLEGLQSGQLGGVALDVFEHEPCTDSPLFQQPGVLCTPHLGASTEEAQIQVATEAVELLINFLRKGEIRHAVNTAAVDPKTLKSIRGYIDATYRLGIMLAGWHGGAIEKVSLRYYGEVAQLDHRLLTSTFCAGLLRGVAENANVVNSLALCEERGIRVTTRTSQQHETFSSVIAAKVKGQDREYRAATTVFGRDLPRLVEVGDYRTDAYMDGNLLILAHRDVPGVIGYVGNILATEDVNIAQMAVGRVDDVHAGPAIGVLNLDTAASQAALDKVSEYEGIESVRMIQLPAFGEKPSWLM